MVMLTANAATDTIATHDLFTECRPKELAALGRLCTEVAVAPGRVLMREGEPGRQFLVVTAGRARVEVGSTYIGCVEAGSFMGEVALLAGGPSMATVTALTPMHLLLFGRGEFRELIDLDISSINRKMLQTVARRLRCADSRSLG